MTNATDFLLGGGTGSAKFDNVNDSVTGLILSTEVKQQTDISSGQPLVWDNGDPRMQLVVTLQTEQRDDDDDDGKRAVYVKGSKKAGSKSLHDAVAQAVRAAGAKGIEEGGHLTVTFAGTEPSSTRGFNDRKLYSATYVAPDKAAKTGDFLGTEVNMTTGEVTSSLPPATPVSDGPTPEQIAALKAAGIDPKSVFPTYAG